MTRARVAILGAGIAGLTAAFRRAGSDQSDLLILEGAPGVGGSIRTLNQDGFVLEAGPNTLRTNEAAERLLADLDLNGEVLVADGRAPRWIVREGRARAIAAGPAALFTSVLSAGAKLRVLCEPFVSRAGAGVEDESVHAFFERRFGREIARYAIGPIVSGVYADDPTTLSMRCAFPKLWEAERRSGSVLLGMRGVNASGTPPTPPTVRFRSRTVSFPAGLARIPQAIAARLTAAGAAIVTGSEVTSLEGPGSGPTPVWQLKTADGRMFEAERILSTLPAPQLARLLGQRLPRSGASLTALACSPLAVVLLAFRPADAGGAPRGFGTLIPRGEGFHALGVLYPSSLFPARFPAGVAQTTVFLGGALDPALVARPEEELLDLAESEVRRLHPNIGERIHRSLVRWSAAIPRLPIGHRKTLDALDQDLDAVNHAQAQPSLLVTGPWRDGVSLGDRIARGEAIGATL
ncbi:MAG: protoporphyrinogen oxidase [Thermoanaerobaculia bacterium]